MRWSRLPKPRKEWRKWFAWYPVDVGDEVVWLEWLERKTTLYGACGEFVAFHEYRPITAYV
jgi:hypothetical protein